MSAIRPSALTLGSSVVGLGALAAGCLVYAGAVERNAFRLRRFAVPVLPAGAPDIRVLHISDLHMTPRATARQAWVSRLAALEPDLVINTGDNLSHTDAVPFVMRSLGRLVAHTRCLRLGLERLLRPHLQESARLSGPSEPDRDQG